MEQLLEAEKQVKSLQKTQKSRHDKYGTVVVKEA